MFQEKNCAVSRIDKKLLRIEKYHISLKKIRVPRSELLFGVSEKRHCYNASFLYNKYYFLLLSFHTRAEPPVKALPTIAAR